MMTQTQGYQNDQEGFIHRAARFMLICVAVGCGMPSQEALQGSHEAEMKWSQLPIQYKIATTIPQRFHSDIHAAFEEWNTATNTEVFVYAGLKELHEDQLAPDYTVNENVVLATNRMGNIESGDTAAQGTSPLARAHIKGVTSIRDVDIYLFEFDQNFVNGRPDTGDIYSVKSVVMHEAGHMLLGAGHTTDESSIMTAQLYPRGHEFEKLTLGEADINHFFELYFE